MARSECTFFPSKSVLKTFQPAKIVVSKIATLYTLLTNARRKSPKPRPSYMDQRKSFNPGDRLGQDLQKYSFRSAVRSTVAPVAHFVPLVWKLKFRKILTVCRKTEGIRANRVGFPSFGYLFKCIRKHTFVHCSHMKTQRK